ncbi:MAG: ankyrin repeat domain-containing protein, partial [Acidobacteria bacterium]|nr:ankyrin repeat domain-containing protein [Acidobacteriota bacterium]
GADVDDRDHDGETPLSMAEKNGNAAIIQAIRSLMNEKAGAVDLVKEGNPVDIKKLLDSGFDINTHKVDGTTMLTAASFYGRPEIVELLIASGADLDWEDSNGNTALSLAVRQGHQTIVEQLVFAGADVNTMNHTGWSPLMFAVVQDQKDTVDLLHANGANIDQGSNGPCIKSYLEGEFAGLQQPEMIVPAKEASLIEYFKAAEKGNWDKIKKLIGSGIPIDTRDNQGSTALMIAALPGQKSLCFRLILAGIDIKAKNKLGFDALMITCGSEKEQLDLVDFLIMRGIDINAQSTDGITALMNAAGKGHYRTVKLLISKGADIKHKNRDSAAALDWAEEQGHKDIVKLLIAAGGKE